MSEVLEFLKESNAIEGVYSVEAIKDAMDAWKFLANQGVITIPVIKQVHKILMENQMMEKKYVGAFRDCPVYIGGREALNWKLVQVALVNWIKAIPNAKTEEDCKKSHVQYEKIHWFCDGN